MTVNEFMVKSGISVHLKGFEAVEYAINICMENSEIDTMKIYEIVSNKFGISEKGAERRIRFAIKQGFNLMDEKLKLTLFGNKVYIRNRDYLKTVAYAIKNHVI